MTPDELEQLVLGQGAYAEQSMVSAFNGMTEAERAKLSKAAQQLFTQLGKLKPDAQASQAVIDYIAHYLANLHPEDRGRTVPGAYVRAAHAVLALCPLTWAKKPEVKSYVGAQSVPMILSERKPAWLTQWVEADFEGDWTWSQLRTETVREWMRQGICEKPGVDEFSKAIADTLVSRFAYATRSKVALQSPFLAEPDLIEYIPDFFRIDCNAFKKEQYNPSGQDHIPNLPHAIVALVEQRYLDRDEMIDLTFEGLASDKLLRNSKSGLIEFLALSAVTPEEKAARQDRLFELLSSPVPHVRKFALDEIAMLEKGERLDTEKTLCEVPLLFSQDGKGTAISALKLLDRMARRAIKQKADPASALNAIAEGLRHAHCDVQAHTIALLGVHAKLLSDEQWQTVRQYGDFIDQTRLTDLDSLLALSGSTSLARNSGPVMPASYAPQTCAILESRVLFEENRIQPITDLDDLIDTILRCLEYVDTPDHIERIIDGISRLADQRPPDFERRIAPLRKRIEDDRWTGNGLSTVLQRLIEYPSDAVAQLVQVWAGMVDAKDIEAPHEAPDYHPFLTMKAHLKHLFFDVSSKRASPLLSFPTHHGGWIDPVEWVARLHERPYAKLDFLRSLARLAPDNRAAALIEAAALEGETGRIARFALGGDEQPKSLGTDDYDLWITAARCRDPMGDWSGLAAKMGVDDPWPGGARPAEYHPHIYSFTWGAHNTVAVHFKVLAEEWIKKQGVWKSSANGHPMASEFRGPLDDSFIKARMIESQPFAALHSYPGEAHDWALGILWVQQWLGYQCPLDPRPACIKGAKLAFLGMDDRNPELRGMFDVLFCPGHDWGEEAHALAAMGLAVRETEASRLAIDAITDAIDRRVFDPSIFATFFLKSAMVELMKLNRVAAALLHVVAVSPIHAAAISSALQLWLAEFDLGKRGSHELLSVLDQAHASATLTLSEAIADKLSRAKGSSKTAKLAKSILARAGMAA